jgi:hypothetical protein
LQATKTILDAIAAAKACTSEMMVSLTITYDDWQKLLKAFKKQYAHLNDPRDYTVKLLNFAIEQLVTSPLNKTLTSASSPLSSFEESTPNMQLQFMIAGLRNTNMTPAASSTMIHTPISVSMAPSVSHKASLVGQMDVTDEMCECRWIRVPSNTSNSCHVRTGATPIIVPTKFTTMPSDVLFN